MARHYLTLSQENQFRFVCPIFDTQVKFSQCVRIRDAVYIGARLPVRRGCQACVSDSKCPAAEIVRKISFHKDVPDDYGSSEPVVGKIRKDVLEKIAPIMVMQRTLDRLGVPDAERMAISASSDRIRKLAGIAPMPSDHYEPRVSVSSTKKTPKKSAAQSDNKVNQAAATGDLAAAINQ